MMSEPNAVEIATAPAVTEADFKAAIHEAEHAAAQMRGLIHAFEFVWSGLERIKAVEQRKEALEIARFLAAEIDSYSGEVRAKANYLGDAFGKAQLHL